MASGVAMSAIWLVVFSGDRVGYLNILIGPWRHKRTDQLGHSEQWLMPVMVMSPMEAWG